MICGKGWNKTIWKFPFGVADSQVVMLPKGAKILSAGVQNETPVLWAMVDPEAEKVPRTILLRGTGHPAREAVDARFIDTIFMVGGAIVFHVFELEEAAHADA